jgi:hypothetical protein
MTDVDVSSRSRRDSVAFGHQVRVSHVKHPMRPKRPLTLAVLAVFMMTAGVAEVVTAFRHEFFGIRTSTQGLFTLSSVVIGLCYAAAGALVLTMRRRAALTALVLLGADVLGRLALVAAGLYPLDSWRNVFGIISGTVIVAGIATYLAWLFFLRNGEGPDGSGRLS